MLNLRVFSGAGFGAQRGNISVVVAEIQEASAMRIVPPPASSFPLRSAAISSAFCCHSLCALLSLFERTC